MAPVIRRLTVSDASVVAKLGRETFLATFGHTDTAENMQAYVNEAFALPRISAELAHPESEFYCVLIDDLPAGYLKINTGSAQTEPYGEEALEIQRLYLHHAFHGRGLGSALMAKALERGRALGKKKVWLGVADFNEPALRLYRKFGFTHIGEHYFTIGASTDVDLIYGRAL